MNARDDVEEQLVRLVGRRLVAANRDENELSLTFTDTGIGDSLVLYVYCAWRLATGDGVLVGDWNLYTPSDLTATQRTFDFRPPGATWWDVRVAELLVHSPPQSLEVTAVSADFLGGARISFIGGIILDIFPNFGANEQLAFDYWRLHTPAKTQSDFIVATYGIGFEVEETDQA